MVLLQNECSSSKPYGRSLGAPSLLQNNGEQLDDESLRTLMCEAEAIVNSRPVTVNQLADPDSPRPLTPNHLLIMKSRVVLAPPGTFQPADMFCRKR